MVLRNNFKCESWFWSLDAQLHFCTPAACTSLSVDEDLDQTTVGCAGKLVPGQAASFRLGCSYCCSCALVCKKLNESVKEEATWHLRGPLPLLKTPEALIGKRRNHGELLGLTYQSDSPQTMICSHCLKNWESKLVAGASGPRSSQRLKHCTGRLPALPARGELLFWATWSVSARQPFSSVAVTSSWILAFLYAFKPEPYCILKCRRFPIQISNVLVWINNTVASKVPAGKGKLWLQQSASCTKPGLCGETWHLLLICLLSSWAGIRQLHVLVL